MSEPRKASRWPIWTGLVLTVVWFTAIGTVVWLRRCELVALELNELGDLLAGRLRAPPMQFFGYVVGYFQQAQELNLQVQEIHLQVEAAQRTADAALGQAERDVALAQPVFQQGSVTAQVQGRHEPAVS